MAKSKTSSAAALLGMLGGRARAKALTAEQRSVACSNAASTRWDRYHAAWWKETVSSLLSNRPLEIKYGHYYGFAPNDELLSIDEVALRLNVPKSTVYELCRRRSRIKGTQLPHFKIGRLLKFRWSAVCDWISTLEKEAQS